VAAVARASPHRRVKDDEVVAHYARAGDRSPGVIGTGQLAERVVVALPRLCILRIQYDPAASDEDSKATAPSREGRVPAFDEAGTLSFGTDAGIASRSPQTLATEDEQERHGVSAIIPAAGFD
jgi:hypothetical protein